MPCWLCPVKQGRGSQIDCAVTEQYRAVNFRPEFTVLVEFWAADKFHYTRTADTVNTVRILSLSLKKCVFLVSKNLHLTVFTVSAALV